MHRRHFSKTAAASSLRSLTGRRHVLKSAAAFSTWLLASGHTPYKQWQVYRRKHLLIGANKADPPTYELGKKIAASSSANCRRAAPVLPERPMPGGLPASLPAINSNLSYWTSTI